MAVSNNRPPIRMDAVRALRPNHKGYSLDADGTLTWFPANTEAAPTSTEIDAKLAELTTEYNNQDYQRKRKKEFPTIGDQLDLLYWDKKNGTNKWVEAVDKVKSDNPKP